MPSVKKPLRNAKTGQFAEWTPLTNPAFLQGVRTYVKAADALLPLFQAMADSAELESAEWKYRRLIASLLSEMSSNMAGQLVAHGERLIVHPPADFLRGGFVWGDMNNEGALLQCQRWYQAANDVQWFFGQLKLSKKPPASAVAQASKGDLDSAFRLTAYALCSAMDELKEMLHERLSQADDKEYLQEAKKPALRLPMMGASHG